MINGWQQLKGIKENSLKVNESERGTTLIISPRIPEKYEDVMINSSVETKIDNGPA